MDVAGTFSVSSRPTPGWSSRSIWVGECSASVDELATTNRRSSSPSATRNHRLTSDILVSNADTAEASQALLDSDPARLMDQVELGAVAEVIGTEFIASVSPPTALSLTGGLDEYFSILAEAAAAP